MVFKTRSECGVPFLPIVPFALTRASQRRPGSSHSQGGMRHLLTGFLSPVYFMKIVKKNIVLTFLKYGKIEKYQLTVAYGLF